MSIVRTAIRPYRAGPVLADTPQTLSHVWFDGTRLRDTKGLAWTMNGTVPQVARAGRTPPGAGPFSDANYYSLGSGSDVLDFAGDFSACVIYRLNAAAANQGIASDAAAYGATGAGWRVFDSNAVPTFDTLGPAGAFTRSTDASIVGLNVVCFGRAGTVQYLKVNLRPLVAMAGALIVPATSDAAKIGRFTEAGVNGSSLAQFEATFTLTAPADALFIAMMQRVKQRLAITAW